MPMLICLHTKSHRPFHTYRGKILKYVICEQDTKDYFIKFCVQMPLKTITCVSRWKKL